MRHMRAGLTMFVKLLGERFQYVALKCIADFKRMSPAFVLHPCCGQSLAELHHRLMPLGIRQGAWPSPLNAERRFAPAVGRATVPIPHLDTNSGTGNSCKRFAAELQRDASGDRQKIQFHAVYARVRRPVRLALWNDKSLVNR